MLALEGFLENKLRKDKNFNLKDAVAKFDFTINPTDTLSEFCGYFLKLKDLNIQQTAIDNELIYLPRKFTGDKYSNNLKLSK